MNALPALAVAAPLIAAVTALATARRPNLREGCTLAVGVLTCLLVAPLWSAVAAGARPALVLFELIPGVALGLRAEPLGMIFASIASFLWVVTSVYSIGYMRGHGEANQTRFYAWFAVAISGALGVAFAADLFTLFVFYEVLTLSTYPLVTHAGTPEARAGGRTYLGVLLVTSMGLLLPAVVATGVIAGTLEFRPGGILAGHAGPVAVGVLLTLYVFGIGKAAVMPVHRWLPAAMVAPTPVSALLHAVAVVKAGVFSILKISIYVFGPELLAGSGTARALAWAAGITVVLASLVAMRQDNLKRRLAYSTVSQLSYIVMGAMLAKPWALAGAGMHIAMHAFAKITLFFCAGAVMVANHHTEVSQMRGIGRRMPITMTAFLVASLSIIGLPPLGGMWSKWYLALGAVDANAWLLLAALLVSSLLNIAYLLPIPAAAFFTPGPTSGEPGIAEAPAACVGALALTAVGCVVLFFNAGGLLAMMRAAIGG